MRGEQAVLGDQPGRVFGPEVERPGLLGSWQDVPGAAVVGVSDDALAGEEEQLAVVLLEATAGLGAGHVGEQLERRPASSLR